MTTAEETTAAEQPILEDGTGREQLRKMHLHCAPRTHDTRHVVCHGGVTVSPAGSRDRGSVKDTRRDLGRC
ncbi:unnamed protein product [Boreogadus saida]